MACINVSRRSDQHRGWFHSSLLESSGTRGKAPYESVLTHGFVVDGKGRKMSKSLGNVISPDDILKKYGVDILRLWVVASDYYDDLKLDNQFYNPKQSLIEELEIHLDF